MAQGVRSNRYLGGQVGGRPATGKSPFAVGDAPGTSKRSIKRGKGGSTKRRKHNPVR